MKQELKIIFGVALLLSFMAGSMIGASSVSSEQKLIAAKTACAQFNPETGMFEWLGGKDE